MRFTVTLLLAVTGISAQIRSSGGEPPRGLYKSDPTHLVCHQCTLEQLVMEAFGVRDFQLSGPKFLHEQLVDARVDIPAGAAPDDHRRILQGVLESRLGLVTRRETRNIPAWELVVSEGGSHLKGSGQPADPFGILRNDDAAAAEVPGGRRRPTSSMEMTPSEVRIQGSLTMASLANMLAGRLGKPVKDSTGLEGRYDFTLYWAGDARPVDGRSRGPALEAALRNQLGLELKSAPTPVEILVIDHIEKHLSKR